jgi:L-ribulose-5-phosphate 3-epimerase
MKIKYYFLLLAALFGVSSMNAQQKITIGVIQYDWSNIDKSFAELKSLGFGSCQMNWNSKMDANFAQQLKAASQKYNIKVTTLVGVPGGGQWNFRQGPATIGLVPVNGREAKLDQYHKMIDFCVMAGIPAMHSHFGFIPEDPSCEQYKDFIQVMKGLANYAKSRGVLVYFETGQETPTTLIRALKDIGTGNVFINCDLANLLMYGKANSLDAVKLFGDRIKEFHVKDGKYPDPENPYELGREVKIPTGDVNFPAVIAQLKKQHYQGSLTIECELNGDNKDYLVQTRKYLQKLLDRK